MYTYKFTYTDGEGKETVMLEGSDLVIFAVTLLAALREDSDKFGRMMTQFARSRRGCKCEKAKMGEKSESSGDDD